MTKEGVSVYDKKGTPSKQFILHSVSHPPVVEACRPRVILFVEYVDRLAIFFLVFDECVAKNRTSTEQIALRPLD